MIKKIKMKRISPLQKYASICPETEKNIILIKIMIINTSETASPLAVTTEKNTLTNRSLNHYYYFSY